MNTTITNLLYGYVRVSVDGAYPERLLNRCIEEKITIWQIRRISESRIVFYMYVKDVRRLRPLLRLTSCNATFIQKRGGPFFFKRMVGRSGFVVGLCSFFAIMFVLSNMIWHIEIKGASPQVEHELRQVMTEMGIKPGAFHFSLPSVELIQRDVTEAVAGATWVGVRKKGTTFEFEVVEQQLPEEAERHSPRHLIATKEAVIHDIFVEHGQAMVKPNDFVRKGDILVSGYIGKEDKAEIVPAQAIVRGEIWYKSTVSIPLETVFSTLTGERQTKHYLTFSDISVPIWGFSRQTLENYQPFEQENPVRIWKWTLPLSYKRIDYYETDQYARSYTKEEAIEAAKERARVDLVKHLPEGAEILGEKVLHEAVGNGKVNLQIHYQVLEDITSEKPIIQGD
ncbi:sporulation protein YqfD [Alkalihalobacillus oceani]|uniref:sporulation protein YqfD n=1 Tax=Halalkalibacter oceani TaxID=1653776 RepID=UPI00203CBAF9|nr:sporulation protein YqfD [Halalkalibacter oceani]MCM3761504.1 sporulation protein YqfD [Halalkalibacter oceani]